jgi:putative FmdB family regulatory protein
MPLYEYSCSTCGAQSEVLHGIDAEYPVCPTESCSKTIKLYRKVSIPRRAVITVGDTGAQLGNH